MALLDDLTLAGLRERARDARCRTDMADLIAPVPQRPASDDALKEAESIIGSRLPPVVEQVYTSVANGGFGPGYGLIGIRGGARDDQDHDAVELYSVFHQPDPEDATWRWPDALLPLCHWGCAIYSCVDCRDAEAHVVRFDPNPVDEDWAKAFAAEGHTFDSWLRAWLAGEALFDVAVPAHRDVT